MALIHIGGKCYQLALENRNGWNPEMFRDRYSEVLDRYDFIVGDWGYNQLRLKGFFRDTNSKATKESTYSSLTDYINEYCNFGCAYFVLEKVGSTQKEPGDYDFDAEELPKHRSAGSASKAEGLNSEVLEGSEAIEAVLAEEAAMNEAAAGAAAQPAQDKGSKRGSRNHRRGYPPGGRGDQQRKGARSDQQQQHRDRRPHRNNGAGEAPSSEGQRAKDAGRS